MSPYSFLIYKSILLFHALPRVFKEAGLTSKAMPAVCIVSEDIQLHFEDEQQKKLCQKKPKHMSEWHYNGKLFASHKHASSGEALNSKRGNAWKSRIDLYIKKL